MMDRVASTTLVLLLSSTLWSQSDWTLQQCVERAEQKNLTLQGAMLDRDLSAQTLKAANWAFVPDLNAAATHGYNWGQTIDRYTNTFATDRVRSNNFWMSSNWTLFNGFSLQNQRRRADLDQMSAEEAIAATRMTIRTNVVQRFMEMLSARENIIAGEAQVARTREQLARSQEMVDAGRTARVELFDLKAQLAREEFNVVTAMNQYEQARLRMAQLLLLSPQEAAGFSVRAPEMGTMELEPPTSTVDEVLDAVLKTHPAYKQTLYDVQSAERSVEIARAGSLPSLQLNGSIASGYSGRDVKIVGEPIVGAPQAIGFTENGETVYTPNISYNTETRSIGEQLPDNFNKSVSLSLNVPLFNRMQNRTAIAQARIRYEQAFLRQADQRQQLELTVQQVLNDQRASFRQYEAARNSRDASEEALRYAQERFEQGVINSLDLSNAKTNLNRATADLINARYQFLMATGSLKIMMGEPLAF